YQVPADTDVDEIAESAASAGWQFVRIDGAEATDKAAVMRAMESSFGFPEWFGGNLDALADSLSDVRHERGTVVLWDRADVFAGADPRQYNAVLSVLLSRSRSAIGGPFLTLLRDGDEQPNPSSPSEASDQRPESGDHDHHG
ncbi:MAG: barstar family protein, partial [Actinomycetota bacterium]|nr:barstar family protein [Actinomycetota bacterium]